jgi:hypothetical protein
MEYGLWIGQTNINPYSPPFNGDCSAINVYSKPDKIFIVKQGGNGWPNEAFPKNISSPQIGWGSFKYSTELPITEAWLQYGAGCATENGSITCLTVSPDVLNNILNNWTKDNISMHLDDQKITGVKKWIGIIFDLEYVVAWSDEDHFNTEFLKVIKHLQSLQLKVGVTFPLRPDAKGIIRSFGSTCVKGVSEPNKPTILENAWCKLPTTLTNFRWTVENKDDSSINSFWNDIDIIAPMIYGSNREDIWKPDISSAINIINTGNDMFAKIPKTYQNKIYWSASLLSQSADDYKIMKDNSLNKFLFFAYAKDCPVPSIAPCTIKSIEKGMSCESLANTYCQTKDFSNVLEPTGINSQPKDVNTACALPNRPWLGDSFYVDCSGTKDNPASKLCPKEYNSLSEIQKKYLDKQGTIVKYKKSYYTSNHYISQKCLQNNKYYFYKYNGSTIVLGKGNNIITHFSNNHIIHQII